MTFSHLWSPLLDEVDPCILTFRSKNVNVKSIQYQHYDQKNSHATILSTHWLNYCCKHPTILDERNWYSSRIKIERVQNQIGLCKTKGTLKGREMGCSTIYKNKETKKKSQTYILLLLQWPPLEVEKNKVLWRWEKWEIRRGERLEVFREERDWRYFTQTFYHYTSTLSKGIIGTLH